MLEVLADDVALFSRWELCMAAVGADGVVDELEFPMRVLSWVWRAL